MYNLRNLFCIDRDCEIHQIFVFIVRKLNAYSVTSPSKRKAIVIIMGSNNDIENEYTIPSRVTVKFIRGQNERKAYILELHQSDTELSTLLVGRPPTSHKSSGDCGVGMLEFTRPGTCGLKKWDQSATKSTFRGLEYQKVLSRMICRCS